MASFTVLPATLDIALIRGDEFACQLDFSIDLTSYSWAALVFETARTVSTAFPGGLDTQGDTAATFAVSVTDAAAGQLSLALTETQTASLNEATPYRWMLRGVAPGDVTRTYVSGSFTVRAP